MNASRELSEKKVVFIASMNFIEQNLTSESHFPLVLGYSAFFASLPPPPRPSHSVLKMISVSCYKDQIGSGSAR